MPVLALISWGSLGKLLPGRQVLHPAQEVMLEDQGLNPVQIRGAVGLDQQQAGAPAQGHTSHGEVVPGVTPVWEAASARHHGHWH